MLLPALTPKRTLEVPAVGVDREPSPAILKTLVPLKSTLKPSPLLSSITKPTPEPSLLKSTAVPLSALNNCNSLPDFICVVPLKVAPALNVAP